MNDEIEKFKNERLKVIESMYQYKATEEDEDMVASSQEVIYNWYIDGFETLEPLRRLFDIEDLYDMEIDLKIYPRDQFVEPTIKLD